MGDVGWRRFVSVILENGNREGGDENEEVGVVVAWSPPQGANPLGLYLRNMATTNPSAFLSLLGKVLPMTLAGDRDAPLQERVTVAWEAVDPPKRTE
jgi:hypothetical protein